MADRAKTFASVRHLLRRDPAARLFASIAPKARRSLKTWKTVSKPIPERYQHLRAFAFGDSPELADKLLELVIKGVKTAT